MARIAVCANTAENLANFRAPIIDALRRRGDEVLAVTQRDGCEGRLKERGCKVVGVSIDPQGINPLRDLALMLNLGRIYAAERPDLILNFTIKPVIFGTFSARVLNIPVINTITGLGTAFIKKSWITAVAHWLYRQSLPGSPQVVFQNEDDFQYFKSRRLISGSSVIIVPGSGVDLTTFRPVPLPSDGPVTFLLIARMLRDKGIHEFVDAARALKSPHARFQLLGPVGVANRTAIPKSEVLKWVEEGVVEYLGHTDDIRPYIGKAHCVVLPSYREGMPRSLLEAAAMGRPLIATDVVGCRDVVCNGVNGYLCAPGDAVDLADRMQDLMRLSSKDRTKMGHASRSLAEARFDVCKVVATYLDMIDQQLRRLSAA